MILSTVLLTSFLFNLFPLLDARDFLVAHKAATPSVPSRNRLLGFITRRECALSFGKTKRLSPITTLLSLLVVAGVVVVLVDCDDTVDADDDAAVVDATDDVVNEIDVDDRSELLDDGSVDDGFSSFDTFSTSDLITAGVDSLMLISFTTGTLFVSVVRLCLGFSSPGVGVDNADLPQAVTKKIFSDSLLTLKRSKVLISFFSSKLISLRKKKGKSFLGVVCNFLMWKVFFLVGTEKLFYKSFFLCCFYLFCDEGFLRVNELFGYLGVQTLSEDDIVEQ